MRAARADDEPANHGLARAARLPGPRIHPAFVLELAVLAVGGDVVADAAAACVNALGRDDLAGETVDVGGPQVLTWVDVARVFSDVLGRRVRAVSTPAAVFAVMASLLRPVAPVASRTLALNRFVGASETAWTPPGGGLVDPSAMTTVEQFLRTKAALPATLPKVA